MPSRLSSLLLLVLGFLPCDVDGVRLKKRSRAAVNSTGWPDKSPEHAWIIDTESGNIGGRRQVMSVMGNNACLGAIFRTLDACAAATLKNVIERRRGYKLLGTGGFKHVILVRQYNGNEDWGGKLGALNLYSQEINEASPEFMEVFLQGKPPRENTEQDPGQDQQIRRDNATDATPAQQLAMSVRIMEMFHDDSPQALFMQMVEARPVFGISNAGVPAMEGANAFVTEFAPYGDLSDWLLGFNPGLHESDRPARADRTVKCFDYLAYRLFSAVSSLHEKGFQHCDLKPENFLVRGFVEIDGVMCPVVFLSDLDTVVPLDGEKPCDVGTPSWWPFGLTDEGIKMRSQRDPNVRAFNEYWSIAAILVQAFFPLRWNIQILGKQDQWTQILWKMRGELFKRRFEPQEIMDKLQENKVAIYGTKGSVITANVKRGAYSWPKGLHFGPWDNLQNIYGADDKTKEAHMKVPQFQKKFDLLLQLLDNGRGSVNRIVRDQALIRKRFALVQRIVARDSAVQTS